MPFLSDKKNPENPENFKCRVVCGPGYQPMQRRMKCHAKHGWKRYPGPCKNFIENRKKP